MNKNGWGLRVELAFILLFLICILIATVGLHSLGLLKNQDGASINLGEYTKGNGTFDYSSLENKVASAGKRYYQDKYSYGSNDTVIVSVSTLKNNGYMNSIYDGRNKECKGYAKILRNGNSVGYIKCSIYTTTGYSDDYE